MAGAEEQPSYHLHLQPDEVRVAATALRLASDGLARRRRKSAPGPD